MSQLCDTMRVPGFLVAADGCSGAVLPRKEPIDHVVSLAVGNNTALTANRHLLDLAICSMTSGGGDGRSLAWRSFRGNAFAFLPTSDQSFYRPVVLRNFVTIPDLVRLVR